MSAESAVHCCRLPVVSDCSPQQTPRVSSNNSSSSSSSSGGAASAASSGSAAGMAVSRVPSPPPPEVNTPVAENWCYTQVTFCFITSFLLSSRISLFFSSPFFPPTPTSFCSLFNTYSFSRLISLPFLLCSFLLILFSRVFLLSSFIRPYFLLVSPFSFISTTLLYTFSFSSFSAV